MARRRLCFSDFPPNFGLLWVWGGLFGRCLFGAMVIGEIGKVDRYLYRHPLNTYLLFIG